MLSNKHCNLTLLFPCRVIFSCKRQFTARWTHFGFSEEELQVSATQDAVVLNVAREVHSAGAMHSAVNLHVAVDNVKVFLLVLEQTGREKEIRNMQFFHWLFPGSDLCQGEFLSTEKHHLRLQNTDTILKLL